MGYHRAGFDVVGVDINPQPNYPFKFIQEDAIRLVSEELRAHDVSYLDRFAAIHASPPCQAYSAKTRDKSKHPDLVGPVRDLLRATGLPYVIENVGQAPLINPIRLCGSSFGLGVQRHRLFESNLPLVGSECRHLSMPKKYPVYDHGRHYLSRFVPVYGQGGGKAKEHWAEAMGIGWMTHAEMAEAIPPDYTEFIGHQLLAHLKVAA